MTKPAHSLPPYRGRLEPDEVASGINAALRNAKRLAADAILLLEHGRQPSAASIAALAIEEVGKVQLLRRLAVAENDAAAKAVWKEIRSHRSKNGLWGIFQAASGGAISLGALAHLIDPDAEHARILDHLKQLGFYSDCYGERRWSEPQETISPELASTLVAIARSLSQRPEVTVREMELWVHHLLPAGDDTIAVQQAVCEWHAAMVAEGLSRRDHREFERFIRGEQVAEPWGFNS